MMVILDKCIKNDDEEISLLTFDTINYIVINFIKAESR